MAKKEVLNLLKNNRQFLGTYSELRMLKILESDPNKVDKMYAYTEKEKQLYQYRNHDWYPVEDIDTGITMYQLAKDAVEQFGVLSKEEVQKKIELIDKFSEDNASNNYFMLLCNELRYYTIFHFPTEQSECDFRTLGEGVFGCLENVGDVYAADLTEAKDAIEIWVKPQGKDTEMVVMYLFPYDTGVCTIGG